jgi:hypothetical protein
VPVGEGADSDAGLRVDPLDQSHQLGGVGQPVGARHPGHRGPAGHIAADGQDVVDAGVPVIGHRLLQLGHALGDGREMADGAQPEATMWRVQRRVRSRLEPLAP